MKEFVKRVHALQKIGDQKESPNHQFNQYTQYLVANRETEIKEFLIASAPKLIQTEATVL